MKRVKIAELKDHLSQHLRAVEAGSEVIVTDRRRPIARIVPMPTHGQDLSMTTPTTDFGEVRDRPRRSAGWSVSSTELLAQERREG